jgi:hypothetical protein
VPNEHRGYFYAPGAKTVIMAGGVIAESPELSAGMIQLIWGARPPRAQFDAPRVEHFAMRATEPKGSSSMVVRLADGASAQNGARARVLPISN